MYKFEESFEVLIGAELGVDEVKGKYDNANFDQIRYDGLVSGCYTFCAHSLQICLLLFYVGGKKGKGDYGNRSGNSCYGLRIDPRTGK